MIMMSTISYLFADVGAHELPDEPERRERRDTKSVGDRSELEVMGALIRNGYRIALSFGENHRYDLIADDGERLFRIQVKTGRLRKGAIRMICRSTHAHRRKPGERIGGRTEAKSTILLSTAQKRKRYTCCRSQNWSIRLVTCVSIQPKTAKHVRFGGRDNSSWRSSVVEHSLGKGEVAGSIPAAS